MVKVLIWKVSNDTNFKGNALKILEKQHDGIEIVGEATNDDITKISIRGGYDILLVVGAKKIGMNRVTQDAQRLHLPEEKLLGDWIVSIPGFTLEKYRQLQQSRLSIISKICFGGIISNTLGLPFRSPFVNLSLSDRDFLNFLLTPHNYIEKEPRFKDNVPFSSIPNASFPRLSLGDIILGMVHYKTVEESIEKWNERKKKINWDNFFVTTYTGDEKILEQFDALPYSKKVCFVSFKSDLDSAFYLDLTLHNKPVPSPARTLEFMIHDFARGLPFYYDPFDMLLYGKKTPLIEM